jgi:hypothetical protein
VSSIVCVWCGGNTGTRDREPVLEESENVCRSDKLGIECKGGTNTVDADPDPDPAPEALVILVAESIVLMEPVGEPGCERFGIVTERSKASLRGIINKTDHE